MELGWKDRVKGKTDDTMPGDRLIFQRHLGHLEISQGHKWQE